MRENKQKFPNYYTGKHKKTLFMLAPREDIF